MMKSQASPIYKHTMAKKNCLSLKHLITRQLNAYKHYKKKLKVYILQSLQFHLKHHDYIKKSHDWPIYKLGKNIFIHFLQCLVLGIAFITAKAPRYYPL